MVTTRRNARSKLRVAISAAITSGDAYGMDTIHVQQPSRPLGTLSSVAPRSARKHSKSDIPSAAVTDDSTLKSDVTDGTAQAEISRMIKRRKLIGEAQFRVAVSRPTQSKAQKGENAYNPIEIGESPPRRKKPKPDNPKDPENPHKFQDRYGTLYKNGLDRPPLLPKPANGSIFTGHKSQDMYRMMNAKQAANSVYPARLPYPFAAYPAMVSNGMQNPLPVHHPASTQLPPYQYWPTAHTHSPAQYQAYPLQNSNVSGLPHSKETERSLRKKAVCYTREYARLRSSEQRASIEPDQISEGELNSPRTAPNSMRAQISKVIGDPQYQLQVLIAQTSLLGSLLQNYLTSTDQSGLHKDIKALAATQTQCMQEWLSSTATPPTSNKRMHSETDSAIVMTGTKSPESMRNRIKQAHDRMESELRTSTDRARKAAKEVAESMNVEAERRKARGEELMKIMRSNAEIWGKDGESIADVFGEKAVKSEEEQDGETRKDDGEEGDEDECDDREASEEL